MIDRSVIGWAEIWALSDHANDGRAYNREVFFGRPFRGAIGSPDHYWSIARAVSLVIYSFTIHILGTYTARFLTWGPQVRILPDAPLERFMIAGGDAVRRVRR